MIYTYKSFPFITKGNLLHPDCIIIDTTLRILYFQRTENNFILRNLSSVPFKSIAAVRLHHRNEYFYFSTVEIETFGGKIISASGLKPKLAKELKDHLDRLR